MIPPLYEHQERIIKENKLWTGLWLGTGSSKTRTALEMAEGKTLVICPKTIREDRTWQKNAERFDIIINMKVISKEEFRRDNEKLEPVDTLIIDEAHYFFGVFPDTQIRNGVVVPKKSQLFQGLYEYIQRVKPRRLYLLSATPATKPFHIWAFATLFGAKWDYFDFRKKYYVMRRKGYREIWMPLQYPELKDKLIELTKRFGYTGGLKDFFDVPEQTYKTVYFDLTPQQKDALKKLKLEESNPEKRRARQRTIENGCEYYMGIEEKGAKIDMMARKYRLFNSYKIDYIVERSHEFEKILIFANYTAQIHAIEEALKKEGKKVLLLTGATKDRKELMEEAEKSKSCYVIAQSSISEGYELKTFDCTIYASYSRIARDKIQGDGRTLRSDALKKNLYLSLVVRGGLDEECYKTISLGEDFHEKINE